LNIINVGKTIINHPFGNGKHTTYYWNCPPHGFKTPPSKANAAPAPMIAVFRAARRGDTLLLRAVQHSQVLAGFTTLEIASMGNALQSMAISGTFFIEPTMFFRPKGKPSENMAEFYGINRG
jgi:hypothetical protein